MDSTIEISTLENVLVHLQLMGHFKSVLSQAVHKTPFWVKMAVVSALFWPDQDPTIQQPTIQLQVYNNIVCSVQ